MRTRSRIETPSSSSACSTRCISPRLSRVGVSSSTTTGCVRRTISTSTRTSSRPSSAAAFCRTTSARWVVITEERSTTVAPAISAWRCSSAGTHLAASPNTGSRVGLPGSPSRSSPMASTVPAGELPLAAGTPLSRMTYWEPGRSRLSRVRTGGMTRPISIATLRRSAFTRSSRSPPRAVSTRSTRSEATSSSSGSTRIFSTIASGESGAARSAAGRRGLGARRRRRRPSRSCCGGDDRKSAADEQERQLRAGRGSGTARSRRRRRSAPAACSGRAGRAGRCPCRPRWPSG